MAALSLAGCTSGACPLHQDSTGGEGLLFTCGTLTGGRTMVMVIATKDEGAGPGTFLISLSWFVCLFVFERERECSCMSGEEGERES